MLDHGQLSIPSPYQSFDSFCFATIECMSGHSMHIATTKTERGTQLSMEGLSDMALARAGWGVCRPISASLSASPDRATHKVQIQQTRINLT